MKKNILAILTLAFLFILSGCGSNSKPDGDGATPGKRDAVKMQNNYIIQDESGINFTLAIPVVKKLDNSYLVELSGYGLTVDGCTISKTPSYSPATLVLDGAYDSTEVVYATGTFDEKCTVAGYTFTANQTVTQNGNIDMSAFSSTFDYSNPDGGTPGVPTDGYAFFNATTPLIINQADTPDEIKVQLLKDGFISSDQEVRLKAFDNKYGYVSSFNVTTGADGYAVFNYTSPKTLLPNGTASDPLTIVFKDDNNVTITQEIVLQFKHNESASKYAFFNATTPLVVSETDTPYEMKVQLLKDGLAISGEEVELKPFDSVYGDVSSFKVTTGSDGYAVFNYTSPTRLLPNGTESDPLMIIYKDENGATITQNIVLYFQDSGTSENVEHLYVIPSQLVITSAGEEKDITIMTLNSENIGVSSTVTIEELNDGVNDYGTFNPSGIITTDSGGKAVVKYTAPSSISGITERNITVTEASQNLTQELNIKYNTSTGPGIDYEIKVSVPTSLSVDTTDQITVTIHELGNDTAVIADSNVHEVNLTSLTANILTFGGLATTTYSNAAVKPVAVTSSTLSGTAVLNISASIFNGDHDVVLTTMIPVVVLSGPVSAMSLVYAGTDEDSALGLNKNYYTIHAVDKYNNPAKEGVMLHPSIINGTKVIQSPSAGPSQGSIKTGNPASFEDLSGVNFVTDKVDNADILAIVPNQSLFSKNYLGNWSIDNVSSTELILKEEFFESDTSEVSYVIGNSKRIMLDNSVAAADIQPRDGTFATDTNGNVRLVVTFDPILSGHTVTISANAYEDSIRTGIAQISGLRWGNYNSTTETVINDGNNHHVSLQLGISNISDNPIEHLMDVDIVPSSIESSSSQCELNSTAPMDLNPNANGYIEFDISTRASDPDVKECDITWSKSNGAIFKEY